MSAGGVLCLRRTGESLAVLGAAIAVLTASGTGLLALPAQGASWSAWLHDRDAIAVAVAAVRVAALGVAWYLVAIILLHTLAHAARSAQLSTLVGWVAVPVPRAVLHSVLGVGLTAVTVVAPSAPYRPHGVAAAYAMELRQPANDLPPLRPSRATTASGDVPAPPGAPVLSRAATTQPRRRAEAPGQWRVRPGDHFWSIAEEHLQRVLGDDPSDDATARYWRRLVEHNRHRLADRDNPDLLLPGQLLELVPVSDQQRR